jgi:nucleoside-diphosphate-sugar epimerase
VTRLHALGWTARTPLREGLARTYDFYLKHVAGAGVAGT